MMSIKRVYCEDVVHLYGEEEGVEISVGLACRMVLF